MNNFKRPLLGPNTESHERKINQYFKSKFCVFFTRSITESAEFYRQKNSVSFQLTLHGSVSRHWKMEEYFTPIRTKLDLTSDAYHTLNSTTWCCKESSVRFSITPSRISLHLPLCYDLSISNFPQEMLPFFQFINKFSHKFQRIQAMIWFCCHWQPLH